MRDKTLRNRYLDCLDAPTDSGVDRVDIYRRQFGYAIANDLGTPRASAVLWKLARDPVIGNQQKHALSLKFNRVLGLGVSGWQRESLPEDLQMLIDEREAAQQP